MSTIALIYRHSNHQHNLKKTKDKVTRKHRHGYTLKRIARAVKPPPLTLRARNPIAAVLLGGEESPRPLLWEESHTL